MLSMDKLIIEAGEKTPGISMGTGTIVFHGRSIVEDPKTFFEPVLNWFKKYLADLEEETVVTVKLDYMDSQTTQVLFQMLKQLKALEPDHVLTVNWYYTYGDIEMLELGEIIQGRLNLQFRFYEFSAKSFMD